MEAMCDLCVITVYWLECLTVKPMGPYASIDACAPFQSSLTHTHTHTQRKETRREQKQNEQNKQSETTRGQTHKSHRTGNLPNVIESGPLQYNVFTYGLGLLAPPAIFVLPEGFYNGVDIASALTTELDAEAKLINPAASITVSVDSLTFKFVFEVVGVELTLYGSPDSLNDLIGNPNDVGPIPSVLASPYQVQNYANLAGLQSVAIAVRSKSPKTIINKDSQQGFFTNSLS